MLGKRIYPNLKTYWFLYLTLLLVVLKQLVWTAFVPIFQTPDEQSHFAHMEWIGEKNSLKLSSDKNLSQELALTETLLGTRRDERGNNKYTYHPNFNIPYSKNTTGIFEPKITSIPVAARTIYVDQEASGYPPVYYLMSFPIYKLSQPSNLVDRLFLLRLSSPLLLVGLAFLTWWVGKTIFGRNQEAIVLALIVAFQPMISFVAAGFHPDNLLNVFSSGIFALCILLLKNGFKWKYALAIGVLIYLGIQTKQFMLFIVPGAVALCTYTFFKARLLKWTSALLILSSLAVAFLFLLPIPFMPRVTSESPLFTLTLLDYLKFRLPRLVFEMHPWYWGVFKWLGVVQEPLVLKIITRVVGLALVGLLVGLVWRIYKRDFALPEKVVIFSSILFGSYLIYMCLWDWRLMQGSGFSLGLQGRYLLPLVVPQMLLVLYGLTNLFKGLFKNVALLLLALGFIGLNLKSLLTVLMSYFDLQNLIVQASQYKPTFFKGQNLEIILVLFGLCLAVYLPCLFKQILVNKHT